jgi:hypothetical protein
MKIERRGEPEKITKKSILIIKQSPGEREEIKKINKLLFVKNKLNFICLLTNFLYI